MSTNDSHNDNGSEESTLDVALHCGECGLPLTLTLETSIGLGGVDLKTPVPLCSAACVDANVNRIASVWDRCSCGAVVNSRDLLRTSQSRGIVGCGACGNTGQRRDTSGLTHYWATNGTVLCVPPGGSARGLHASVRRSSVDCALCLHALMVETEIRAIDRARGVRQ